jgi:Fe-S cluster assembly scaffold protein SufB
MKEPQLFKNLAFPAPVELKSTALKSTAPRLIEWTEVCELRDGVSVGALNLEVPANEYQEWVFIQDLPSDAKAATQIKVRLNRDSKVQLIVVQMGAAVSHLEVWVDCAAPGSEISVRGLQNTQGQQKHSVQVNVTHTSPHTRSDLQVWCVGRDRGHSIFNGLIDIKAGAEKVEAFQRNKNLMLSNQATMDSFPKLFIAHDEVKAAHGASVSTLDPDQLAYLQSRGIDLPQAEQMVIEGFVHQVVEGLSDSTLKKHVEAKLGLAARIQETAEWEGL